MIDSNNKTPELLSHEEKGRKTTLKKFSDSIIQKIKALDNNSGDRAIWKLCQKARDLSDDNILEKVFVNDICFETLLDAITKGLPHKANVLE